MGSRKANPSRNGYSRLQKPIKSPWTRSACLAPSGLPPMTRYLNFTPLRPNLRPQAQETKRINTQEYAQIKAKAKRPLNICLRHHLPLSICELAQLQCHSKLKPHQSPSHSTSCPLNLHPNSSISPNHRWRTTKKARAMARSQWSHFGAWGNQSLGRYSTHWLSRRVVGSLSFSRKERRRSEHPARNMRLWTFRKMKRTRRIYQTTKEKLASSVSGNERLRLRKKSVAGLSLRLRLIRQSEKSRRPRRTNQSPLPSR
jgi:hypothetical protein